MPHAESGSNKNEDRQRLCSISVTVMDMGKEAHIQIILKKR
jgi:hypothetical protein